MNRRSLFKSIAAALAATPVMSALAPAFAKGGFVPKGAPHLTGERGPELFVPRGSVVVMRGGGGGGGRGIFAGDLLCAGRGGAVYAVGGPDDAASHIIGMAIDRERDGVVTVALSGNFQGSDRSIV